MKFDIKSTLPHIISIVCLVLVCIVYFLPQFQGKELVQSDIISYRGAAAESKKFTEKTGETALWSTSMFGGMPTYQTDAPQKNNLVKHIERVMGLGIPRPAGYFIFGMIGFYLLMVCMGISPWISLIGALLFGLSTNHMVLYDTGHMSKVRSIMSSPMIIAGVLLVFRKKYLLGGAIFGLFLGLNIYVNHLQMTYYLAMVLAMLTVLEVIQMVKNGDLTHVWKSLLVLGLGAALALGSSASRVMTTLEYAPETVRGNSVLKTGESRSADGGMDWDRAMAWSNGTIDLLPAWIPYAAGGGTVIKLDKDSAFAKGLNRRNGVEAPLYHGDLGSTSGPAYFGAVALFLFLFGAFSVKGKMKWWLVAGVLLTVMLSMGKNFPVVNRLIFDYFPLFNKFRTPNSVLSVTTIFIPILGMLGLYKFTISENKDKTFQKPLLLAMAFTAFFAGVLAVISPMLIDFVHPTDARRIPDPSLVEALVEDRMSMFRSSALRSALMIMIAFGAMWFYMKEKISSLIMLLIVGGIGTLDLFQVDRPYLGPDKFVASRNLNQFEAPRKVDEQILADKDPHFRVHDTTVNPWASATGAFHHKLIGGYHPAKLQRYDDLIQGQIGIGNMAVFNMLNAKYFIIAPDGGQPVVQRNPAAMGNAWFVSEISKVETPDDEFAKLNGFDPAVTAIVHNEFDGYLNGLTPQKNGSIDLTNYTPNSISYKTNSSSEQLAVFSEIWYGPDLGWQAYLDGNPVDHIRANYALRAMKIPAGSHEVVFEFKPSTYYTGETIGLISSLLLIIAALVVLFLYFRSEDKSLPTFEEIIAE